MKSFYRALRFLWLNVSFHVLLAAFSLVFMPTMALVLVACVPFLSRARRAALLRRVIGWYGYVVVRVLPFPLVRARYEDVAGRGVPRPCVIVCNHRSSSDPFFLSLVPVPEGVQVVNTWPFKIPLWGPIARLAGYLSIKEMPVEAFLSRAAEVVRNGVPLVAFPEGTRARTLEMGPFHSAVFRIALQEKVPIVAICISGSERIPPRGSVLIHPGRVRLRQLPTLEWESYKDLTPYQLKTRVRDMISRELKTMEGRE